MRLDVWFLFNRRCLTSADFWIPSNRNIFFAKPLGYFVKSNNKWSLTAVGGQRQQACRHDTTTATSYVWSSPPGAWWVDDFSCKVTLTQWIRNQVTGSGFIRWLQPSWQTARWAGRTNGHWFFNKGLEAVSQPGYAISFLTGLASTVRWPDWHPITGQHIGILSFIHPRNPVWCPRTSVNEYDQEVRLRLLSWNCLKTGL